MSSKLLAYRIAHSIILAIVFSIAGYFSLYKGWGIFFAGPIFLVSVPIIAVLHARAHAVIAQTSAQRSYKAPVWLMAAQTVSFLLFFTFLPGNSDTEKVLMFARYEMLSNDPRVEIFSIIAFVGFFAYVGLSIALRIVLRRARPQAIQ